MKKTDRYRLLANKVGNTTHDTFLLSLHSFAQNRVRRKHAVGEAVITATSRDVAPILRPITGAKKITSPLKIPKNMPDRVS